MICEWCEQEIVLTVDSPTMHVVTTATLGDTLKVLDQVALHDECRPFWEEWDGSAEEDE